MRKFYNSFLKWYQMNFRKIVLLFMVIVVITLIFQVIPYFNIVVNSGIGLAIIIMVWYVLFSPDPKKLIKIALILFPISIVLTIFELTATIERVGELLYLFLMFILLTSLKGLWQKTAK